MCDLEKYAKCPRCGYSQKLGEWVNEANFEYNGRFVGHLPEGATTHAAQIVENYCTWITI